MMNARLSKALVALLAVAAVGACDKPPIEPGSPDAARLATNPTFAIIEVGETRLIQTYLVNDLGNPVSGDVDFEACNALISVVEDPDQLEIEPGTNLLVTANTIGESCINVSGSGFEETITVRVVPTEIELVNLTPGDSVRAGEAGSIDVIVVDADGNPALPFGEEEITYESSRPGRLFFTDEVGAFDTDSAGPVIVTASYEIFGVERELEIGITVLPQVPATAAFTSNNGDTIKTVFPALEAGDTSTLRVTLRDTLGNLSNLEMDIASVELFSSDPSVANVWAEITENPDLPGRVIITAFAEGLSGGESNITGTVTLTDGTEIDFGTARAVVLSPAITTVTPNTGQPGDVVVISGTGLQAAGFTTLVFLNGVDITRFVDLITPTAITLDMPAGPTNGEQAITVSVGGVSSNEGSFDQTTTTDAYSPENEDPSTAPLVTFPIDLVGTFDGPLNEDWYQIVLAERSTLTFRLDWGGSKDLDLLFFNSAASGLVCSTAGATSAHPENASCTMNAGTYLVYVNDYSNSADGDQSLVSYELRGTAVPAP